MNADLLRGETRDVACEKAFAELAALRGDGYNFLIDLTCVDRLKLKLEPRFLVIYRVMKFDAESGEDLGRVEVRCAVGTGPVLKSVASLWPVADWLEREVWDMFGVGFVDRPDIRRLLMYEEFVGHALRKDYPIAKRQPLIGPANGEKSGSPSFNILKPTVVGE